MINNFIAALIALGFWNRSTKDEWEKTYKASWLRTIIYGLLTTILILFYIKTYHVETINNDFKIKGIRGYFNENHQVEDSVEIMILNFFKEHELKGEIRIEKGNKIHPRDFNELIRRGSGVVCQFQFKNDSTNYPAFFPNSKQPPFKNISKNGHLYHLDYYAESIPSIFPILFYDKGDTIFDVDEAFPYLYNTTYYEHFYYTYKKIGNIEKKIEKWGMSGVHDSQYLGTYSLDSFNVKDPIPYTSGSYDDRVNNMNFFSAADLTQVIYETQLSSDCQVKKIIVAFDVPVEVQFDAIRPDSVGFNGFAFVNPDKIKHILHHGGLFYYVKFPTLTNFQLIRSLILTTLLTTFVALFLSNLYFSFRKKIYDLSQKRLKMSYTEAKKLDIKKGKSIRKFSGLITPILIIFFLVYIIFLIYTKDYIFVFYKYSDIKIVALILVSIIIIIIYVNYYFRKLIKSKKLNNS